MGQFSPLGMQIWKLSSPALLSSTKGSENTLKVPILHLDYPYDVGYFVIEKTYRNGRSGKIVLPLTPLHPITFTPSITSCHVHSSKLINILLTLNLVDTS